MPHPLSTLAAARSCVRNEPHRGSLSRISVGSRVRAGTGTVSPPEPPRIEKPARMPRAFSPSMPCLSAVGGIAGTHSGPAAGCACGTS